jgi:N-acetylmuramoyl-L-alanine amidase
MTQRRFELNLGATMPAIRRTILAAVGVLTAIVCLSAPASAQNNTDQARRQFEKAVSLRTELESHPQGQRTLEAYRQVVAAYKKVYAYTSDAEIVTPSIVASAELSIEMGRQYDPAFFKIAIGSYDYLLKEYPHSRYASSALFSIADIQQNELKDPDTAEKTYKDFIQRFPKSPRIVEAKIAMRQITQARNDASAMPATTAHNRQPAAADRDTLEPASDQSDEPSTAPVNPIEGGAEAGIARVTGVRTWNAENYTRVVINLGDSIKYRATRIGNPDRIFFDLRDAKLDPGVTQKTIEVESGFLKSIRLGQNKDGVVRIVLDVDTVKQYSAYLLQNPYRLVIDVHGTDVHGTQRRTSEASNRAAAAPDTTPKTDTTKKTEPPARTVLAEQATEPPDSKRLKVYAAAPPPPIGIEKPAAATTGPKPVDRLPIRATSGQSREVAALVPEPKPTRDGERSLTRALGLKINRIVIDAGHGGHDTGTVGAHGLMEKDLCLDVALRLGKMIQERLPGAEVVYTRSDDTFIPLEERTAIANQAKADLFISIHANSSHDHDARGVETYYLNFATSQDAMEVAARENALADTGLHDLQNMIQKIARNEKIEESKELAGDIQDSLTKRLQQVNNSEKNRGVKKAPFVVLIGANMPSVLAEISFLSNSNDEKMLKKADQRQRIAEGLFKGVTSYLDNLNSLSYNLQKPMSSRPESPLDSSGNPK